MNRLWANISLSRSVWISDRRWHQCLLRPHRDLYAVSSSHHITSGYKLIHCWSHILYMLLLSFIGLRNIEGLLNRCICTRLLFLSFIYWMSDMPKKPSLFTVPTHWSIVNIYPISSYSHRLQTLAAYSTILCSG